MHASKYKSLKISSQGSANPTESVVVSKIRRAKKPQGGEGGRTTSRPSRLRGKRLVKGDIIRRHVWYERRKLFIKGDGGGEDMAGSG